jgi:ubiquinone biosynthesis protein
MMKTLMVAGRDRARLTEIAQIASRFGLGLLLARLGLSPVEAGEGDAGSGLSLPARTRLALEALGPTFVKLGQILATRGDLLPPPWIVELEKLHSQAPTLASRSCEQPWSRRWASRPRPPLRHSTSRASANFSW